MWPGCYKNQSWELSSNRKAGSVSQGEACREAKLLMIFFHEEKLKVKNLMLESRQEMWEQLNWIKNEDLNVIHGKDRQRREMLKSKKGWNKNKLAGRMTGWRHHLFIQTCELAAGTLRCRDFMGSRTMKVWNGCKNCKAAAILHLVQHHTGKGKLR